MTYTIDLSHLVHGQEHLAPQPPEPEPDFSWSAGHEARHVAASKVLGFSTPIYASARPNLKRGVAGFVDFYDKDWADLTHGEMRVKAVVATCGPIGDVDLPEWPPEELPQLKDARHDDELQVRAIVDRIGMTPDDRDQIWAAIRLEALAMVDLPKFKALEERYTDLLLAGRDLTVLEIDDIFDEITKAFAEPPPEPPKPTFADDLHALMRAAEAVRDARGDTEPVPWRDVLEVERKTGLITDEEAQRQIHAHNEMRDLMTRALKAPNADDLRARAEAVTAEFSHLTAKRKPRSARTA